MGTIVNHDEVTRQFSEHFIVEFNFKKNFFEIGTFVVFPFFQQISFTLIQPKRFSQFSDHQRRKEEGPAL